jgi:hypothetical protein
MRKKIVAGVITAAAAALVTAAAAQSAEARPMPSTHGQSIPMR